MSIPAGRARIVVLGASGGVGRLLVDQALARGHEVHAVVRDPEGFVHAAHLRLVVHRGDVHDPASVADVVTPDSVIVSALGLRSKKDAGTLTAGARAAIAARPARIVWLGAIGTGASSSAVGPVMHRLMRAGFGVEYDDKVTSDTLVQGAGGTVVHAGPLTGRPPRPFQSIALTRLPRRVFPSFVPRAAVAQVMLDEAESGSHPGQVVVPRPR